MDLNKFPDYYKQYSWNGKHKLFGYPTDSFPEFRWINSLEQRFIWLVENSKKEQTALKYLINEMIEWGGSQNGILQKFNDGCGEVNLYTLIQDTINNIDEPKRAITCALALPGIGLTYASKLLRFMRPNSYGALDSRIRSALLKTNRLPKIYDGNTNSMVNGYINFLGILNDFKNQLDKQNIIKPLCNHTDNGDWKPSDIEMALFCWAEQP